MNLIPRNFFLDDVFDDFFTAKDEPNLKCDIYEKNGEYHIEMDAPGIKKEDLNIDVDKGYLTITASKKEEVNDEGKTYIRKERYSREYKRSFYIGDINEDEIKATLKDGSLEIHVPKKEEVKTKKTIEIK